MALLPKNSTRVQLDTAFSSGSLVMYENDGVPLLAVVTAYRRQKYVLLTQRAREVELSTDRLHPLPGRLQAGLETTDSKVAFLVELYGRASAEAEKISVEEIWGFVCEDGKELTTKELCELYFGHDELVPHIALRLALITDKIFFRRKGEEFHPRPLETIDELKRAESAKEERQRGHEVFLRVVQDRIRDRAAPLPDESRLFFELLADFAAQSPHLDPSRHKEVKELLSLCADRLKLELPGNFEQKVFALLEKVGYFRSDTNLSLIRHKPPIDFPADAVAEAESFRHGPLVDETFARIERRDLQGVYTFTIDDVSTRDMDDAISLEESGSGFRLGIHISDVASVIPANSLLDKEARRRATSVYCPELTIHMFPPAIAEDRCSLVEGQPRECVSCFFELSRNFEILGTEIVPTTIKSSKRYSYDEVDDLLEAGDRILTNVYSIAAAFETERIHRGALKINKRDVTIGIGADGVITLTELDENSPARSMIGEMMISANALLADFAVKHEIPVLFRLQDPPEEDPHTAPPNLPPGPAFDYSIRSRLKRSVASFKPGLHAGLGLPAYIQATSPIRRFMDLCNQRQILHFIAKGRPLYPREDFEALTDGIDEALGNALTVSKESKRFWLLRYLKQIAKKRSTIAGTVTRTDLRNPIVELDELFMPTMAKAYKAVRPGDRVVVRIESVDPRTDYLKTEIVGLEGQGNE